jgi:hypothetical protein
MVSYKSNNIFLPRGAMYFDYIDVIVTIHQTGTVSVAIACSFRPIAIDIPDLLQLCEVLTRTEIRVANDSHSITIPRYTKWIVKMWHFGVDTIDEYGKEEFHVTFEERMSDLYRIYTKRMKDGNNIVRVEHQEYPNQGYADAFVQKLFPDGHLVDPDKMTG